MHKDRGAHVKSRKKNLHCLGAMEMYQVRVRVGDNVCRDIQGEHSLSQLLQLHGGVFHGAGEVL